MTPPAIAVRDLHFTYEEGAKVLNGVNLEVAQGETVVLAGLSGCGKTTLCHILCGIIPGEIQGTVTGSVRVAGEDVTGKKLAEMATRIGLVFQDADNQMVCTTVEDELAFGPENMCVPPEQIRAAVDAMADRLHIADLLLRSPASLSGGQKRLVALGGVLMLHPDVVVLDEPMSNLDEQGRALVRTAIQELAEAGATVVIVEHDLELVTYADRWIVLEGGRVALCGTPAELLGERESLMRLHMIFEDAE